MTGALVLELEVDLFNLGIWLRTDNKYFCMEHKERFIKWLITTMVMSTFQAITVYLLISEQFKKHYQIYEVNENIRKNETEKLGKWPFWLQDLAGQQLSQDTGDLVYKYEQVGLMYACVIAMFLNNTRSMLHKLMLCL